MHTYVHTTYNNVTGAMHVNTNVHVATPDKLGKHNLLLVVFKTEFTYCYYYGI